ncbi:MAG: hypothetical protein KAJ48_03770, partial [Elusimicrobiales bacterium]|nr:hypothetical protein [Elusimicrobiales bacterium]
LKKRIEKARERFGNNIIFQQAARFAEKLIALKVEADTKEDGERGLNKDEQAEINKDLLKLWQK